MGLTISSMLKVAQNIECRLLEVLEVPVLEVIINRDIYFLFLQKIPNPKVKFTLKVAESVINIIFVSAVLHVC